MNVIAKNKQVLFRMIDSLAKNKNRYLVNPTKDFIRKRKLDFKTMIRIFLSMEGDCIGNELLKYFNYHKSITNSAFCQQRVKIQPVFFQDLFMKYTKYALHSVTVAHTYKGYRLLACDGTVLHTQISSDNPELRCQGNSHLKGYLHLTAFYDLLNQIYITSDIQYGRNHNEKTAMIRMLKQLTPNEKYIITADRGFEAYNTMAHLDSLNQYYLIRIKNDKAGGIMPFYDVPKKCEFDIEYERKFTRQKRNCYLKHNEHYVSIRHDYDLDFFTPEHDMYPMKFRLVRIKLDQTDKESSDDGYECFVTNLPKDKFSMEELKFLYCLRWGIETSFRALKYCLKLNFFHSKKEVTTLQEIYARMLVFNFSKNIILHTKVDSNHKKYVYQINFRRAVTILRNCFRSNHPPFHDIERLLLINLSPIRPNRKYKRWKKKEKAVFIYI